MSKDKAGEARKGLFDSVVGKAREVAGAVTGKDDLVEEGQLQQAAARERTSAVTDEAVADAKQAEAAQQVREASREATEHKRAAGAQAALEESAVEGQRQHDHAVAARDAERQETVDRAAAERRADEIVESRLHEAADIAADASSTEHQAAAEKVRLQQQAAAAEQQAAQLRAHTQS